MASGKCQEITEGGTYTYLRVAPKPSPYVEYSTCASITMHALLLQGICLTITIMIVHDNELLRIILLIKILYVVK
jgi:hypothetical protein